MNNIEHLNALGLTKNCSTCKTEKPLSDFMIYRGTSRRRKCRSCCNLYQREYYKTKANNDRKKDSWKKWYTNRKATQAQWRKDNPQIVKLSHRKRYLKAKFGITPDDYDALYQKQNGACAICGELKESGRNGRSDVMECLQVDHCHESGEIRGLLCLLCNSGIGKLRDSVVILENAIKYLDSHNGAKCPITSDESK